MSGIFGIYHRDSAPLEPGSLNAMAASMKHRGPDETNFWQEGPVGFGHCMLHNTPESPDECLPYVDNEADVVITADARIDNREELTTRLGLVNRLPNNITDSQMILFAYRKWNVECVNYLHGDFSFIIWHPGQQQLFCARDQLGIKPFCYFLTERLFVFASEVRAILEAPHVPRTINQGRIADFLVTRLEGIDKTSTFYEEIFRLPPAHTMLISRQQVKVSNYWKPDPDYETTYKNDKEYVEAFRELLSNAVRVRLRCNSQAASMLSGGVDSSSVVGVAHQLQQDAGAGPLPVYSCISNIEAQCLETSFIRQVVAHSGVESFTISPGELQGYEDELLSVFDMLEEPFDSDMTIIMLIYLMARKNGNHVVLDGVEGDIVHSLSIAYPAFLFRSGHFFRGLKEINGLWQNHYRKGVPFVKILMGAVRSTLVTRSIYQWRRKYFPNEYLKNALAGTHISQDFADRVDIRHRLEQLSAHGCEGLCATPREQHIRTILHPYLTVALERYDRIAAVCSVEARHPLLDRRLVEFSVSLPWDQKVREGWSKYVLRRASEPYLPADIVWRKGWEHVGWSFTSALMRKHYDHIKNEITVWQPVLKEYVDDRFLGNILQKNYTVNKVEDETSIWRIYQLANWLQRQQQMQKESLRVQVS